MKNIIFLCACFLLLAACNKSGGDSQAPVITVVSPANHQNFTGGQTVTVSATITDDNEILAVHLYVTNKATGASILHFQDNAQKKSYDLSQSFIAAAGVTYTLEIDATDASANSSQTIIEVNGN